MDLIAYKFCWTFFLVALNLFQPICNLWEQNTNT
jgi:hypothetical protein